MFNARTLLIDAFVEQLQDAYFNTYGGYESQFSSIIGWAGRMALENIANSDAFYHDVEHTILVTLVGQEILKGKHLREGRVMPSDWLHFVLSLLCHDIGYVRGVLGGDQGNRCVTGLDDDIITLPRGSTDASLAPYHVDRGMRFIKERFGDHQIIDAEIVAMNIERTRFPIPEDSDHQGSADYPGLVRAADLIGQLADPDHLRKFPALFAEFAETGVNEKLGYKNHVDLREGYPAFFWNVVHHYTGDGLRHLGVTQEGKQWIANLYSHVFEVEHSGARNE